MDKCNPAFDHNDCDILMNIKKEYIHAEDQDIVDYPPTSIMVKQENDNSTQVESCGDIDKLPGLKCDTEPVVLRGDSSSVFPNPATEVEQPGTWNMHVIKSELSNNATDSDMDHLDSWIGEGIKSKSSNCYTSRSDHVDHTYATTPDRYNINAVKSELTDTCTDQQPIHYVEKHVSSLHGERYVQDINMAEHNITNAQIKTHSRPHCHKSFNCVIQCDKRFSYSSQLMEHMMTPGIKPYSCVQCHKIYRYSTQLKEHMRTHARDKPYLCIQCRKRYAYSRQLKEHMRTHTRDKPYLCLQCHKMFSNAGKQNRHMMSHIRKKAHICCNCGKTFSQARGLHIHARTHTGDNPCSCHCDEILSHSCNLREHMRTGETLYSCTRCDKRFCHANSLKEHTKTRTAETLYSCTRCDKRFFRANSPKKLMRTRTGQKLYSCNQCDKRYTGASSLKDHIMTHSGEKPYSCIRCAKRFIRACSLKEHMKTHTGEKPYSCYQCDKRFYNATKLKVHMRAHTGEKPYSCIHCGKIFRYANGLWRHMRTHTVTTRK